MNDRRTLLFDVETAANVGLYFDPWKENNIIKTKQEWYMLSFSAKWLGEKHTYVYGLPDFKTWKRNRHDDRELLLRMWKFLDEADIVVAHNGDRFDVRKAYARFIKHGINPPSPYRTVDTLKAARRFFKFDSNRLDHLGDYLGVGRKKHTEEDLWDRCMEGEERAWRLMKAYNAQDVKLLEKVYLKMLPFIANHPRSAEGCETCPKCGSDHVNHRGHEITPGGNHKPRYQCQECGGWFYGKTYAIHH